ncbi:uncharacterized protein FA14DRAFT_128251 [Meira miltonrushii]|uniref:C2H2-type domain-containing protein n=1 Tax=Meira miltonrushii TaxID=1280837 RepID=A0A316V5A4_9BASI|nr:uncharacterized protein FA14DRAFT_128251 [Meira miltonrushii]PWN31403.1 hypothetical protein FA14DRAFT_128251 [Meira miltonrushii]
MVDQSEHLQVNALRCQHDDLCVSPTQVESTHNLSSFYTPPQQNTFTASTTENSLYRSASISLSPKNDDRKSSEQRQPSHSTNACERKSNVGPVRHLCPYVGCNKHFSSIAHARRHCRIHKELPPHRCSYQGCHASFSRRDNCIQHQKRRHGYRSKGLRLC